MSDSNSECDSSVPKENDLSRNPSASPLASPPPPPPPKLSLDNHLWTKVSFSTVFDTDDLRYAGESCISRGPFEATLTPYKTVFDSKGVKVWFRLTLEVLSIETAAEKGEAGVISFVEQAREHGYIAEGAVVGERKEVLRFNGRFYPRYSKE